MISLETAKKLKSAGLVWEPKVGDIGIKLNEAFSDILVDDRMEWLYHNEVKNDSSQMESFKFNCVWLSRLDQLLSEIEKRGYVWQIITKWDKQPSNEYKVFGYEFYCKNYGMLYREFDADSPEEATAQSLLWILKQEVRP